MKICTYVATSLLTGLLLCYGPAILALQPLARAEMLSPVTKPAGATMHESSRIFPTGMRVPGSGSATSILLQGSKATLTAPAVISSTAPGTVYAFLFWDIAGQLYATPRATFTAPARQSTFRADAWYLPEGGGGGSCPTTGCTVTTYGFSLLEHRTLPGSPIASVVPSSAWTAPSATVSTTTAVAIMAANPVEFVRWLAPGATASGLQLAVGAGVSTIAIAFYGPNPCQTIQNEITSLSPGDFPPPDPAKEYQAGLHALELQLRACEASHGA